MSDHPRPSLTADIAVLRQNSGARQLLLIKRRNPPYRDCRALPGGFLDPNETIEACARRELAEETCIASAAKKLYPIGCFSRPERDPRGWVVSFAFLILADEKDNAVAADDAADAQWFDAALDRDGGEFALSLCCGEEKLSARLRWNELDSRFETLSSDGIAFDHSEIIAAALKTAADTAC